MEIEYETTLENGVIIDSYIACAYAEGFCEGEDASDRDVLCAWSYLIGTGLCWQLQGWYGRNAQSLIDKGWITKTGKVNWDTFSNAEILNN